MPMVESALSQLSLAFDHLFADNGLASIPSGHLLKSSLLMALSYVRSERQFCAGLEHDLLVLQRRFISRVHF